MKFRFSLTLNQVFFLSVLSLTVLLGVLFWVLLEGSRKSILQSSDQIRVQVGNRILDQVGAFRDVAEGAVSDIENQIRSGVIRIDRPETLSAALYAGVLDHPDIAEATFTHADGSSFDGQGNLIIASTDRWQISVYRTSAVDGKGTIVARWVRSIGNVFFADESIVQSAADLMGQSPATKPALDPTAHLTFITSVMQQFAGQLIWSDLHWSQLDPSRRVEVTVQKSLFDDKGNLLGVVRVGLLAGQLDKIVAQGELAPGHRCFLCDAQGGLVTRLTPADRIEESGDNLRVASANVPPEIAQALKLPALAATVNDATGGTISQNGTRYLVTFLSLPRTQDWILGVVAPEEYYLGPLEKVQNEILYASLAVIGIILLGGIYTLRAVHIGLTRVMGITGKMKMFDFSPSEVRAPFRDIRDVIKSIEQSKTAVRAMGKYVPLDLVRDLYQMNREPMLGGKMMDISMMFTDIRGFTDLTERLSPDRLATALGYYLEAISAAIQSHKGTIDKYIGDSVMVLWSAPRPVPDDAAEACAAALACVAAANELFQSPKWEGSPPWYTRYGLHRDCVRVGHFGSPNRMNYTALGDGVNLASRLEGLNKTYGTTIIASQAIRDAVGDAFSFRLLDRVAVKGKMQAVQVYELLGKAGEGRNQTIIDYEKGMELYWAGDFRRAGEIFQSHHEDRAAQVLAERCGHFLIEPPPMDWGGVYISMSK